MRADGTIEENRMEKVIGQEKRQEKITVIVPVYNARDYLRRCVRSLVGQSWQKLQILLVDDGSTDGSGDLCETLAGEDARIQVIHKENGGVSSARNAGLLVAEGEYVSFVDADDWLKSNMLERLLLEMKEQDCQVAVCGFYTCRSWEEGIMYSVTEKPYESHETEVVEAGTYLQTHILHGDTRCWSKLYERKALQGSTFREDLTIGEDMLFFLELLPGISRILLDSYQGYFYFDNAAGAMQAPFRDSYMDQITCWQEAGKKIDRADTQAWRRVNSILVTSAMLVVNKLAMLSAKERKEKSAYLKRCRQVLRETLPQIVPAEDLDRGYRLKVNAFLLCPGAYLGAYRCLKRWQERLRAREEQDAREP